MVSFLPLQQAFSAPVAQVEVQVVDTQGGTSQLLLEKMGSSMQVVADQLFLERDSEKIAECQVDYVHLLQEIGERVFTGYELLGVQMEPGARTKLVLYARPWSGVIEKPVIDLQFSGVEPQTAKLLEQRIPQLKAQLEQTIRGASVDAGDWAGGVLRKLVREEIAHELPEFKAAVDVVQEDNKTVVQVVIYPVGQLVRTVRTSCPTG